MEKIRQVATIFVFLLMLFGLSIAAIFMPDQALSTAERRKLEQRPTPTVSSVLDESYMETLETYLQDQFPARERFRSLKAEVRYSVFRQSDSHTIYLTEDGSAVKIETPLKEDQVLYCANKINSITDTYLQGHRVFCAVVPDKNYFASEPSSRPHLDYARMMDVFTHTLTSATYINLFDSLTLSDYYLSDAHWKQDSIFSVQSTIAQALGIQDELPPPEAYTPHRLYPFSGVYLGQSALSVQQDELVYLTTDAIDAATVISSEKPDVVWPVYAPEKLEGMDGYDVFLHGAQAVLTIENPLAKTDRELVIFRDSFGSSFAPLLLDAYSKITLIDLRYIASEYLSNVVTFHPEQDVLFLYNTSVVNSGMLLR